jgi:hypothetical protein
MAITWADVEAVAPDLSSVATAAQTLILEHVNTALKESLFSDERLKLARTYLAAHHGEVVRRKGIGIGGPMTMEAAGGITRQFAAFSPTGSHPLFDATPYGKIYRSLLPPATKAPMVI